MTPAFYKVVYLDGKFHWPMSTFATFEWIKGSLYYLYLFILSAIDLTLNIKLNVSQILDISLIKS